MLARSPDADRRFKFLIAPLMFAAWALGTTVCSAADDEKVTVRNVGPQPGAVAVRTIRPLHGAIAPRILQQVRTAPFTLQHDSPILLDGETLAGLTDSRKQELKATYRAGYTIVLLDANMQHIKALHAIVGEGVSYRSKDTPLVMAYALRRENYIPTATLLTWLDPSPRSR